MTLPGSGLVFINDYGDGVTDPYRAAVVTAENFLQSHFTDQVTVGISFDFAPLSRNFVAQNDFSTCNVSYGQLLNALQMQAVTADDLLAVGGLPSFDPSGGLGFSLPTAEAVVLGLVPQTNSHNDHVTLNSNIAFNFDQDAIGAVLHEITEGVFGRTQSLGIISLRFEPFDLFRFTAAGLRDFTGGQDGLRTFFGIDGAHLSDLSFHNSISTSGVNDGFDLGDWSNFLRGDAFGPSGPSSPGFVSATDLQVLDVLGWTPASASQPFIPAPDEFASSLADVGHSFGVLAVGGSASGALQQAGDHDWFRVTLQAGSTYTIGESGQASGAGTLADPFLKLHDASGAVMATNNDIVAGVNPDSRLSFTAPTTGTYYVDAGAFADGYAGTYKVDLAQTGGAPVTSAAGQVLTPGPGDNTLTGGEGDDTITGGSSANYLRGGAGDDLIFGGAGFSDINGNQGNDTIHGDSGDAWLVGGQGDDLIYGGSGTNLILGNLGDDTLHAGSGNDVLRGGKGDDVLFGGPGADWLSGDLGNNTETGGTGPTTFHSFTAVTLDLVTNFNEVKGDRVQLDPGTAYTVSQVGANTVVNMTGGGQMILENVALSSLHPGWIFVG